MVTIENTCFKIIIEEIDYFSPLEILEKNIIINVRAQLGSNVRQEYTTTNYSEDYKKLGLEGIINMMKETMVEDFNYKTK